jgi:hypothetical protein
MQRRKERLGVGRFLVTGLDGCRTAAGRVWVADRDTHGRGTGPGIACDGSALAHSYRGILAGHADGRYGGAGDGHAPGTAHGGRVAD